MILEAVEAVVFAVILFSGLSILMFQALVGRSVEWLGRCRFVFPLFPCPPKNMVVFTTLSGDTRVYYNVRIEPGQEHHVMVLPTERIFVKGLKPVWATMLSANYGPTSPFGVALRALLSIYYGLYFVFVAALFDGFNLFSGVLAKASLWATFVFLLMYTFQTYQRMAQATNFPLYEIVEWEKKEGGSIALPSVGPRGVGPAEFARLSGAGLRIDVPETVSQLFNSLKSALGRDDLAIAALLARVEDAERLKVDVSEVKRREMYARQLARSMVLSEITKISIGKIIIIIITSFFSFLAGFYTAGGWISFG